MPALTGMTLIRASLTAGLVQLVVELDLEAVGIAEENLQRRVVVHELLLEGNPEPLELRLHLGPAGGVERDVVEASGAPSGRRDVFLEADVQHRMGARVEPPARPAEVRAEAFFKPQDFTVEAQRLVDLRRRDDDVEVIDEADCHDARGSSIAGNLPYTMARASWQSASSITSTSSSRRRRSTRRCASTVKSWGLKKAFVRTSAGRAGGSTRAPIRCCTSASRKTSRRPEGAPEASTTSRSTPPAGPR